MGSSDGAVLGLTTILNNGPNNQRFNIVLVAEGFQNTTADQNAFNQRCQDVVDAFQDEPWFGAGLLGSINIHRLNVWSTDQGADSPAMCADGSTGSGAAPATFFDATYCSGGIQRCLAANWTLVRSTVTASLPTWHAAAVIVNSTMRGGCASGNVFATALSADFLDVVMHELGHAAFGLADEYSTWQGCGSGETDRDNAPSDEPGAPNITAVNTLGGLKWADLVLPTTPVPTMENPDCTECDLRPNVRPDDTEIGLFEGAGYYHCGYYRPAYVCKMRDSGEHFCRVCARAIFDKLDTFFAATPGLAASATELDFGNVGVNASLTVGLDVVNVGTVPVTGINVAVSGTGFGATPVAVGTLAPGAQQTVDVTFGPVATTGVRTGVLTITSSAPTITVDLRANACTPVATMSVRTADGGNTLAFGDVARQLTMYRWFEVRNLRAGCVAPLMVNLQVPTGGFAYAPGTPMSFTVPAPTPTQAYTSKRVYVAFTSPATGGPDFTGSLMVTSGSPVSVATLTLTARAVDPPPVDSVLVIDRSGSMSEPTGVPGKQKIDLAIQAADLYVGLLKDNDRIGLVRFNHNAANPGDVLQTLIAAGDETSGPGRVAIRGQLNTTNLAPTGATSIGGGTILGSTVLDAASATARAVLVLTDGIQNRAPDIPTARTTVAGKTPRQRVFAVGLGLNQLEDSLVQLASVTNGTAHITGELVADREFLLQKLYVQILSDVADEAFVEDPVEVIYPGMTRSTDVWIGEVDVAADFIVAYRLQTTYPSLDTWLEAPDGTIIRPTDAGTTYPNVRLVFHEGHYYFRTQFPTFPDRPEAHIGRWRIWLENRAGRVDTIRTHALNTASANVPFVYAPMAKARSNLLLRGYLIQSSYLPGSPIDVVLEPVLYGLPVDLDHPVEVRVVRPDGVASTLALAQDPSGQYRGTFTGTGQLGAYQFTAHVTATTPLGNIVTRYRSMTGIIFRPGGTGTGQDGTGTGDGGGTMGDECRRAMAMLDRLETLLERGQGLSDADLDMARSLVKRLRVFADRCCGCPPSRTTKAESTDAEEALRRLSELLAQVGSTISDLGR
jgi:hypothetical protein